MSMPSEINTRLNLTALLGGALLACAPLAAWFVQNDSYRAAGDDQVNAPKVASGPENENAVPPTNAVANVSVASRTPVAPLSTATSAAVKKSAVKDEVAESLGARPGESYMHAAIRWSQSCLQRLSEIRDYSADLHAREFVDGTLQEPGQMKLKVRHEPFSVYLDFNAPRKAKGQECIYVAGHNDGKLLAHATGLKHKLLGTLSLKPTSSLAMNGNRHPVTEIGIRRLLEKFIEIGEREAGISECQVTIGEPRVVNGRSCECMVFTHPEKRAQLMYYQVRVYVDPQWDLPVRFESYDWPAKAGEQPQLLEEYTYENLVLNPGLTDVDFDVNNPAYRYVRRNDS